MKWEKFRNNSAEIYKSTIYIGNKYNNHYQLMFRIFYFNLNHIEVKICLSKYNYLSLLREKHYIEDVPEEFQFSIDLIKIYLEREVIPKFLKWYIRNPEFYV